MRQLNLFKTKVKHKNKAKQLLTEYKLVLIEF